MVSAVIFAGILNRLDFLEAVTGKNYLAMCILSQTAAYIYLMHLLKMN